ncbi:MAG: protein phosphatase [Synechococcaceae cyanobacterium]|nr:protein phosphatase [Synechococcaceae cyanobacterium]
MNASATSASSLQATLFDFAIGELVQQHRDSFQPLWSRDSWAKLLIWLSLNCGCSAERADLEAFAAALGPVLSGRMRHRFFSREWDALNLKLLADPAEPLVLVMPLDPALQSDPGATPDPDQAARALEQVGLLERLEGDRQRWQQLEGVLAIPWAP